MISLRCLLAMMRASADQLADLYVVYSEIMSG